MSPLGKSPPASEVTPEPLYLRRREFVRNAALFGATAAAVGSGLLWLMNGIRAERRSPAETGAAYLTIGRRGDAIGEAETPYADVTTYNNFYEFGTDKGDPAEYAGTLRPRPWTVEIAGEVRQPGTIDLDQLLDPEQMPGQRRRILPWPYVEGLRIDEAMHPLALLAVGLYGKTLPNQNGAPLRLVVPWKYGFKGIKSIVKIELTETQPPATWNLVAPDEYGFYANVNPAVDHPRWSQATERRIGELRRRPTLPFNGYAEQVAHLYTGMDLRKFF